MKADVSRAARVVGLALIVALALPAGLASAHSFNVVLWVPLSGPAAVAGAQMRDGFMLAAKERDSHAGQESDGHLGGLDVYVELADSLQVPGIRATSGRRAADIVAVIGSPQTVKPAELLAPDQQGILLMPGETAFPPSVQTAGGGPVPAAAAFIAAFETEYGYAPAQPAAQGYNAARRIDAAVRAQGGVDDKEALKQHLAGTERKFDW